jgi:hypothetical protein
MTRDDRVFMVARAMARSDGLDPDRLVIDGRPMQIAGRYVTWPDGAPRPLYQIYFIYAAAAVDELDRLKKE